MSKTVDDLIGVYIEASNAVVWEAEKRGLCPMTLDMQRAGIAAVVRAVAPDDDEIAAYNRLSYRVQEQLKCECEYLPEDRCIRCSVVDALKCLETRYHEILGDAGNEKVAGGTNGEGAAAAEPNVAAPATDPAPVTIKETIAGTVLRMEQGYTGGMNDLSVTPATDPAPTVGQRLIKAAHEAAAIARGDMQPGRVYVTDPAPAVCEWTKRKYEPGFYATPHGIKFKDRRYDNCGICGREIKFTEAKT